MTCGLAAADRFGVNNSGQAIHTLSFRTPVEDKS
jgi:hypothetical protein